MSNIATLKPIQKGDGRGGREKGNPNKITRVLKTAIVLAGEQSRHSKDGTLLSYLVHVADEYPALYIGLIGRLIPVEAKIKTDDNIRAQLERLDPSMPLDEMIRRFEAKIKSDYRPPMRTIEHDDDDDEIEQ